MHLRGNSNRWLPIVFAAVVSEAVPMSSSNLVSLREFYLRQMSKLNHVGAIWDFTAQSMSYVCAETILNFPMLTVVVLLFALCAYLAVTKSLTLWGFLCGELAGLLVLFLGYMGVISFLFFSSLGLHLPQPIFYYLILRLPVIFGLAIALWVAMWVGPWVARYALRLRKPLQPQEHSEPTHKLA